MHVSSLSVERFRGIRSARIDGLRRVTLLLGQNNASKTSFLEALYIATGVGSPARVGHVGAWRGASTRDEAEYSDLFYRMDTSATFDIRVDRRSSLEDTSPIGDLIVQGYIVYHDDESGAGPNLFDIAEYEFDHPEPLGIELRASGRLVGVDGATSTVISRQPYNRQAGLYRPKIRSHPELAAFRRSVFIRADAVDAGLSKKLSEVIQNKDIQRVVYVLHKIDSKIEGIALGDRDRVFVDTGLSTMLSLGLMGTGLRRLLSIIATILTSRGSLLLIDEIDDGLHHTALLLLWETVLRAAEAFDVQVVATTHSLEALQRLVEVVEREDMSKYRDDVAAFDLVRDDDDVVKAYRYDFEQLDFALEHDIDVRS